MIKMKNRIYVLLRCKFAILPLSMFTSIRLLQGSLMLKVLKSRVINKNKTKPRTQRLEVMRRTGV
jgi:hypothetical protein